MIESEENAKRNAANSWRVTSVWRAMSDYIFNKSLNIWFTKDVKSNESLIYIKRVKYALSNAERPVKREIRGTRKKLYRYPD